jgi:hypothetical protein
MIALMAVGTVYALWSKTLYINGTVNTGTLDAVWSADDSWDSEPVEKDVSHIECYVDYVNDPSGETLAVEVVNAYPCIDYYQKINLENTGTIPLHIYSITFPVNQLPATCTVEILPLTAAEKTEEGLAGCKDIVVSTQLEPLETAWGKIHVHLTNDAIQSTTYYFTVNVNVHQWNEP